MNSSHADATLASHNHPLMHRTKPHAKCTKSCVSCERCITENPIFLDVFAIPALAGVCQNNYPARRNHLQAKGLQSLVLLFVPFRSCIEV
jgi:hypothetical protein